MSSQRLQGEETNNHQYASSAPSPSPGLTPQIPGWWVVPHFPTIPWSCLTLRAPTRPHHQFAGRVQSPSRSHKAKLNRPWLRTLATVLWRDACVPSTAVLSRGIMVCLLGMICRRRLSMELELVVLRSHIVTYGSAGPRARAAA